ncbi:MAG: DNA-formamidopyrimidine glycosylase, partial [Desulfobacca sp.]|nr:DNA-formamidopyrimidine glycosylase [Desulfobacca sp.]
MPELPEVETIVRRLGPDLIGLRIQAVQVLEPKILRLPKTLFIETLTGTIIREIRRKGKMILLDSTPQRTLVLHLKMTGQLLFMNRSAPIDRHTHLIFNFFHSDWQLRYRDIRKFGFWDLLQEGSENGPAYWRNLGPDPFEITSSQFVRTLQAKNRSIKSVLLDQSAISGLGNIYVDESLFQAAIHPMTRIKALSPSDLKNLHQVIKKILNQAIQEQGSTLRDYRRPDGTSGGFQNFHQVYGRSGLPCPRCRNLIQKIRVAG